MALVVGLIFGAFIGSFLNVCIHRLPRNESVVRPPSRCYSCGSRVAWYDNIPVLSFLVLRARCRWCGSRFSARYLVSEVAVGALTGAVCAYAFSGAAATAPWLGEAGASALTQQAAAAAALLCLGYFLYVSSVIDLDHLIIPDELTKSFQLVAPLLAVACGSALSFGWDARDWLWWTDIMRDRHRDVARFATWTFAIAGGTLLLLLLSLPLARWVYSSFCPQNQRWAEADHRGFRLGVLWFVGACALHAAVIAGLLLAGPGWPLSLAAHLAQALLGSLAGWCSLYLVGLLGTVAFRRNAMGFGDVKFLAPIGAFLGPIGVVYAFFAAAVIGSLVGIPMRLARRQREIPFGPYLALGAALAVVLGPAVHRMLFPGP